MKLSPITRRLVRNTERQQRLGEKPCCGICGEANPRRLMRYGHHVTFRGRDYGFVAVICGSCHLEIHCDLTDEHIEPECEGPIKARTASRLRALAVFREQEAKYLRKWAAELEGEC